MDDVGTPILLVWALLPRKSSVHVHYELLTPTSLNIDLPLSSITIYLGLLCRVGLIPDVIAEDCGVPYDCLYTSSDSPWTMGGTHNILGRTCEVHKEKTLSFLVGHHLSTVHGTLIFCILLSEISQGYHYLSITSSNKPSYICLVIRKKRMFQTAELQYHSNTVTLV